MATTANELKAIEQCEKVINLAKDLFDVDLTEVAVEFNMKGKAAGWAWWRRDRKDNSYTYGVKFNMGMVNGSSFDTIINDVIPHEFAHVVCYMKPHLGKGHDRGWAMVCRALGGTGERLHQEPIIYGTGKTYEYITTTGKVLRLSTKRHNRVQSGETLRYKGDFGQILPYSKCMILGEKGIEYDNPVAFDPQAVAVNEKAVDIVAKMRPKGTSKAAMSRALMAEGVRLGKSYEDVITAMMRVNSYTRGLAVQTYKANAHKVGITL